MPSKTIHHFMKMLNSRMVQNYQRGLGPRRVILLLTTIGRKSGLPRITPIQFEQVDNKYFVASARGKDADWFKNICVNPQVSVQIGNQQFNALAEPVTDPVRIAEFLELRLKRHPIMVRLIMHLFDGLPLHFNRSDLEAIAARKALVILHPVVETGKEV